MTTFLRANNKKIIKTLVVVTLLGLILGRFWIVGTAKVLFNTQSSDGDESAYLSLGLDMRETGMLTDGTRPPLYILTLLPAAQREWSYFTWAKFITLAQGMLGVLAVFWVGRRMFGLPTGLLAAFFLSANREFHLRAATIYADTLMVTVFLGSWYFLIKSFSRKQYLYPAGLFTGLAYLTKGSAPLLLGTWGMVALWHYRQKIVRQKSLLIVPIVFFIVTMPLLVYNARYFGDPFYNFATTHVMWMDSWAESQVADPADLPDRATYFQTHTPAEMVNRLQNGAANLNSELAFTLIPSREWPYPWLGQLLLALFIIAGLILLKWGRSDVRSYYRRYKLVLRFTALLFAGFYLFSAWYGAVLIESRFLLPVLGPFYLLVADVLVNMGQWGWKRLSRRQKKYPGIWRLSYAGAGILIGAWAVGWLINTTWIDRWSLTVDPFESDYRANVAAKNMVSRLVQKGSPTGPVRVIFGPSKSLPLWMFPRRFSVDRIPVDVDTWPLLAAWLRKEPPDFIVVDSDTARRRRRALSEFFAYNEAQDFITVRQIPPGWMLRHLDDAPQGVRWAVFSPAAKPPVPLETANFGNTINLTGYQLQQRSVPPDGARTESTFVLDVTLYWESTAEPAEDYVVFIHLTAPDGFVKAQKDRQPFYGLWPTGRWQPGRQFADTFSLELDPALPPGDYLLVTGLYAPASGNRLPVITGPTSPSPNSVRLINLQIIRENGLKRIERLL